MPRPVAGTLRLPSRSPVETPPPAPPPAPIAAAPAVAPEAAVPAPGDVVAQASSGAGDVPAMPSGEALISPDPAALDTQQAQAAARAAVSDRRRERAREAQALLCARWPAAFRAPIPVPLAVGIARAVREGLGEERVASQAIKDALYHWMNDPGYLAAVANGVRRVHLDGTDAGEPDEQARAYARAVLAARQIWMRPPAAPAPSAAGDQPRSAPEGTGEGSGPGV